MKNILYGIRPVIEAITSGKEIDKVLIQKGLKGSLIPELRDLVRKCEIPVQYVPVEKLNRLTGKNHQGVVAFGAMIQYQPVDQLLPSIYEEGRMPFMLVLDRITDVRNIGAIVRTAECAGVDLVIIPSAGSARIGPDAMKTSAGALNRVPVHRSANMDQTVRFLKESGLQIVACTEKGDQEFHRIDYKGPLAIVMGSEEDGISPALIELSDHTAGIPMLGEISSLNVSVAAGIILYEALKQRSL